MKTKDYFLNHKPVTRRDFLSQGLITFSAFTFLPTPFGLVSRALADGDCGGNTQAFIPFLSFDCAGGAMFPANFLVGGPGGPKDLLKSYDRLGWDPKTEALNEDFGLPLAKTSSKFLEGLLASASAEARVLLRMGSFCHYAQSDSSSNPLNAVGLVAKLGYKGKVIGQSTGMVNSVSGGNSQLALAAPDYRALYVPNIDVLKDSVGISKTSALGNLSNIQLKRLFGLGQGLSKAQLASLGESITGKDLSKLTECSYLENEKKFESGGAGVDPRLDPNYVTIYGINANSESNLEAVVSAGIVKNVIEGATGPGVITIGGCDYHNSTQTLGDSKDREIGVQVGRAVQAAHIAKKPLFFQIITDGGCSNIQGTRMWSSDANDKCMTLIGYYKPDGAPAQKRLQVGYYIEGQGAAKEAIAGLGDSPVKVAASVFANYLSLHVAPNQLSAEFFKYVKSDLFPGASTELEQVLVYGAA